MSLLSKLEKLIREENETEMCTIDMNISDEMFLKVALMAHENDVTFNQLVAHILEEQIESDMYSECKHTDANEKMGGYVCNDCDKFFPHAEWEQMVKGDNCPCNDTVETSQWGKICKDCGKQVEE